MITQILVTQILVTLAWKSAVVCAAGLALAWLVRRHSVTAQVSVLRLTAALMLALPLLSLLLPALRIEAGAPEPVPVAVAAPLPADLPAVPPSHHVPAQPVVDWRPALIAVYGAGVALGLIRLLADLAALNGLSASARPVEDPVWRRALGRAGTPVRSRLLVSPRVAAPLSFGISGWGLRPVILLNPGALDRPQDAEAVLAHEAGHIQRRDWLFLMLARVTLAVFWFNPLAWWLRHQLEQRSEEAVDAFAVARIDRTAYARALLGFAGSATTGAANGMAHGTLKRRIGLILSRTTAMRSAPLATGLAALACVGLATPLAALELVRPQAASAPADTATTAAPAAPVEVGFDAATSAEMTPASVTPARPATLTYTGDPDEATQKAQQEAEQAQRDADQAKRDAEQAQRDAEQQKRDAEQARRDQHQMQRDQEQAQRDMQQAKAASEAGIAYARDGKQKAEQAWALAQEAKAQAMVQKLAGADQMDDGVIQLRKGAEQLRREAVNLRDPAYRRKQIDEAAARGDNVTDEHLQSLIPEFEARAVELDQHAKELQARAAGMRQTGG